MSYFTYILKSESTDKLYIGSTNNLEDRIQRHNEGRSQYTKGRGPWTLLSSTTFESRAEAVQLEHYLKGMKSRDRVLAWIVAHPG